ncbi:MAG: helix-turn-helix domain-containing protein [Sphingomicrobium sp.]
MSSELHLSLVRYAPGATLTEHSHDEAGVSLVLGGSIFEAVGNRQEFGNPGDVVVKPAGLRHRNRVAPTGAILLAIKGNVGGTMNHGWRWVREKRLREIGMKAARLASIRQRSEARETLWPLLEILAGDPDQLSAAEARRWLRHTRDRIEEDPRPPTVARLAEIAAVHPGSLSRAFRRHYGCSVSTYIRRVRVRRAAAMLMQGGQTVGEIAAAVGCYDQSHLCREFNLELGISPSSYRLMLNRGMVGPAGFEPTT